VFVFASVALFPLACSRSTPSDTQDTQDTSSDFVPITAEGTLVVKPQLAGIVAHTVAFRADGTMWGTYSSAQFQSPSDMTLLALPFGGIEECVVADPPGLSQWLAVADEGASLDLKVGNDSLALPRVREDGQVYYELIAEGGKVGATADSPISVAGATSDVIVVHPFKATDGFQFWDSFLKTGVVHMRWEPANRGYITLFLIVSTPSEEKHISCAFADDGSASVETGWGDVSTAPFVKMAVARTVAGTADVTGLGTVLVTATSDVQKKYPE
jgi:hypothetical protein